MSGISARRHEQSLETTVKRGGRGKTQKMT